MTSAQAEKALVGQPYGTVLCVRCGSVAPSLEELKHAKFCSRSSRCIGPKKKVAYRTREQAEEAAGILHEMDGRVLQSYKCPICDQWHHTGVRAISMV